MLVHQRAFNPSRAFMRERSSGSEQAFTRDHCYTRVVLLRSVVQHSTPWLGWYFRHCPPETKSHARRRVLPESDWNETWLLLRQIFRLMKATVEVFFEGDDKMRSSFLSWSGPLRSCSIITCNQSSSTQLFYQ